MSAERKQESFKRSDVASEASVSRLEDRNTPINRHSSKANSPTRTPSKLEETDTTFSYLWAKHKQPFKSAVNPDLEKSRLVLSKARTEREEIIQQRKDFPIDKCLQMINEFLEQRRESSLEELRMINAQKERIAHHSRLDFVTDEISDFRLGQIIFKGRQKEQPKQQVTLA